MVPLLLSNGIVVYSEVTEISASGYMAEYVSFTKFRPRSY
jgi:hypothetical protein